MDMMIDELFALQAARSPDAVAVSFEGDRLTYRELEAAVDRLAADLRGAGVGPGALVALFLDRSLDLVVAMLGALRAGGAYVPLDPTHPGARLAYILEDAKPRVLLTRPGGPSAPPAFSGETIAVDAKAASAAPAPGAAPPPPPRGVNDLAYVIYTSGSTGAPKGVAVEHRSVVNMLQSMLTRPGLGAADVLVAITTPTFDISVLEIFLPLICGARVVVASDAVARDGVALAALIESVGATVLQATPSGLRMLIDSGWRGAAGLKILCGGEAWPEQLAAELLERCGSLWNMYGPTETTVWSAVAKIEVGQPVRIGRPIANTALYVLDGGRQLLPVGVTGELYIGGAGLARGYFNRDELTRERFVRDPYSQTPGAKMYRTGDLVRRHADGRLEFFGRTDHQVKIRGHRVELGEIEAKLAGRPGVQQAVVVARDEASGGVGLVAYYIPAPEGAPSVDDLRRTLQEALPAYMVPAAFVAMGAFPLTPSGKVDRKAMPAPVAKAAQGGAFVQPHGEVEEVIAQIWGELLGSDRIGANDNFFDFGGHSLMAARFISRVNKAFGAKLGISSIFRFPTVSLLGAEVNRVAEIRAENSHMVQLQKGRGAPPIYFIRAGTLEQKIASLIGEGYNIFGVDLLLPIDQSVPSAAQASETTPTLKELATSYVDAIVAHAGAGPVIVAGYSFSGKVAFEAASLLLERGVGVSFVLLMDTYAWGGMTIGTARRNFEAIRRAYREGAGQARHFILRLFRFVWEIGLLAFWLLGRLPVALGRRFGTGNHLAGMLDSGGKQIDPRVAKTWVNAVVGTFAANRIPTSGVLIRARVPGQRFLPRLDPTHGWGGLFEGGVEIVDAAGDHFSLILNEQNLEIAAQRIRSLLDRRLRSKAKVRELALAGEPR
jgi:amino acid adenylation domain-containing protein